MVLAALGMFILPSNFPFLPRPQFFPVCVEMRPANFAVVSTVFCCCVLLKNNGPALRCCVLPRTNAHSWPRAFRFGLGRFSRFCPLLMTSPAVTSWGSASGQSAKQADPPCMWSVLFVVWPETAMTQYDAAVTHRPLAAIQYRHPVVHFLFCSKLREGVG